MADRRVSRDERVRQITAELNDRMDALHAAVEALRLAVLERPDTPPDETGERLVKPA